MSAATEPVPRASDLDDLDLRRMSLQIALRDWED